MLYWFLSGLPAFVVRQATQSCLEPVNTRKKSSLIFANLISFGIIFHIIGNEFIALIPDAFAVLIVFEP